ncbi:MAG: hypothetical protein ACFFBR_06670 [Promethearchaeota archaeon]
MTGESSDPVLQTLKCSECGAKITPDALQPGSPLICEYCGAINVRATPPLPSQKARRGARHPRMRIRHSPFRAPLLHTTKLLADKGAIDTKILRQYTKRNIDNRMRPAVALRQALKQMRDEGKLDHDKILRTIDELIAEKKIPPRARDNFARLVQ